MAQLMTRQQFRKQLQYGLNTSFGLEYKRYPKEWMQVYDQYMADQAVEEDVLLAGLGPAQVKPEGSGVAFDAGGEAWTKRYVQETIALAFAITEEMEEDNLYGKFGAKYSRALARSMNHTKEVKGAATFANGFDTNFPIGDGKPLYATDHPLWGGGTFSNTFTVQADLSEASLEEANIQIHGFVDDRGINIMAQPKKLIVPYHLQHVADRLLYSGYRTGTADNDISSINYSKTYPEGYCMLHRLTDSKAWFIKTDVPDGFKYFWKVKLRTGVEGDFESGNVRYRARERYVFGVTDPRCSFGSSGQA